MSVARNSTYNLVGGLVSIVVALVSVPLFLQLIGTERYGVLALAWAMLGYFGVFDLGLTRATVQRLSSEALSAPAKASTIFWSALAANGAAGVFGGAILYFAARFAFASFFHIEPVLQAEIFAALPFVAAAVPMTTVSGVLGGALMARHRFLEVNVASVATSILLQVVPLATAFLIGPDLEGLIISSLIARFASLLFLWFAASRQVVAGTPAVSAHEVKRLLKFGGWVTVSWFVGPLMTVLDRFVIGARLGAVAVALYTIPWQLAQRLLILPTSLQSALYPHQAAAHAEDQVRLTSEGIKAVAALTTPLVVGGIFLMEPFLKLWLGAHFDPISAQVGRIALLGFWGNGMAYVPFAQVEARGDPRTAALVHLVELPLYLAVLYLLMRQFGLAGAATAFALRCVADAIVFNMIALRRHACWLGSSACAAALLASAVAAEFLPSMSKTWAAAAVSALAVACVLAYAQAPLGLRNALSAALNRLPIKQVG